MPSRTGKCVIGVDLGGTNVRAGAFYEDGLEASESYSNPSNAQQGTQAILESVAKTIRQAAQAAPSMPICVGMAIPGHIDDDAGTVVWAPNFGETIEGVFHYWVDVDIRGPIEAMTGIPIAMGNDANLAALGEYKFGTGRNSAKCLVILTLGTGVGGGVVLAPSAVQGDARGPLVMLGGNKGGAELGHVVVNYEGPDCNAGEYGAIEGYIGRDAIIRRAWNHLRRGRESILPTMLGGDIAKLTPKDLSIAAAQGDEVAIEVFEDCGTMLGVGIGNYINIFAPDIVAVGGQIAKAGDFILKPAIKAARKIAIPSLFRDAKVVVAEQIEDAGMMGGAALAIESARARGLL